LLSSLFYFSLSLSLCRRRHLVHLPKAITNRRVPPPEPSWSNERSHHHSHCKLPLSFASFCLFLFHLQLMPVTSLTTSCHTERHQPCRHLLSRQISLPLHLFFFFFLPSLLPLHANSGMWIIIHVPLSIHSVINSATWIIIHVALFIQLSY
jgi:hypothetical protein